MIEHPKTNRLLYVVSLVLTVAAFMLAVYHLNHAVMTDQACLPSGCVSRTLHPILYWLSLGSFAMFAALMANLLAVRVLALKLPFGKRQK